MLNTPELIREVLVTKADKFCKGARQVKVLRRFEGNGLANSEGDFWKRQRKMIQPAFHHRRLNGYAETIVDLAAKRIASWHGEINIAEEMMALTLDNVTRTLFSSDVSGEIAGIGQAMTTIQQIAYEQGSAFMETPDWLPTPKKTRQHEAIRYLDQIIMRIIHERRESQEDTGDLLSMLLMAQDDAGSGMTDQQVRDEVMTLFIAGHETTATALSWASYLLAANAESAAKIRAEVDTVVGSDRLPALNDLPKLLYTEAVFKEAMRLYPPVWYFSRDAAQDVELAGYKIKRGSLIHLFPFALHRNPAYFPNPSAFVPERFLPGSIESIPDYAYIPFGGGPRICIGNSFSMMEGQLILATLAQRCEIRLAADQGEPEMEPLIALRAKGGVRVQITPRMGVHSAATADRQPRDIGTITIRSTTLSS
jgi:cytochrome P450